MSWISLFAVPGAGVGVFKVWYRNYMYFRYTIWVSVFWVFLEPLLYLFGIGYGLGQLVGETGGMSYAQFFAPALMLSSGMFVAFFEGSYGSFTKLTRQNTYQTILLTPVTLNELVLGEVAWAASKAMLSVIAVLVVALSLDLFLWRWVLPALLLGLAVCWFFASFSVALAAMVKTYDSFVYAQSGVLTPLILISGLYFPTQTLPSVLQSLGRLSPLTYSIEGMRELAQGKLSSTTIFAVFLLLMLGLLGTNFAIRQMEKRLLV